MLAKYQALPRPKKILLWIVVLLALLLIYFFMTPRGSVSFQLLIHDPIHAMTFRAERERRETGIDKGLWVYKIQDPHYVEVTGTYLNRYTIHRYGPFCWAVFGHA